MIKFIKKIFNFFGYKLTKVLDIDVLNFDYISKNFLTTQINGTKT
jgi:hypothetical protein